MDFGFGHSEGCELPVGHRVGFGLGHRVSFGLEHSAGFWLNHKVVFGVGI